MFSKIIKSREMQIRHYLYFDVINTVSLNTFIVQIPACTENLVTRKHVGGH